MASSGPDGCTQLQPNLANCVASMLISTLLRSGCSKSIIVPMNETHPEQLLHIWLFNANITFSSSALTNIGPSPAVKVLYRFVSKEEADQMSESLMSDVQDITLPDSAVQDLKELLENSSGWLPECDRRFKEWAVGLVTKSKSRDGMVNET